MNIIKYKERCHSCNGTGVYIGMAEWNRRLYWNG